MDLVIWKSGDLTDQEGLRRDHYIRKYIGVVWSDMQLHRVPFWVRDFVLPDGATLRVSINANGPRPIARARITGSGLEVEAIASLTPYVWIPEGLIITPKTDAVTYGFGIPKYDSDGGSINPPYGTADGFLRECLINRYKDAQIAPALAGLEIVYRPLAYTEESFDIPGLVSPKGELRVPEFSERFTKNTAFPFEDKRGEWYGHFVPQVSSYGGTGDYYLAGINDFRANEEEEPVYHALTPGYDPAKATLAEMAASGLYGLTVSGYRDGYQTSYERRVKDGQSIDSAEIIGALNPVDGEAGEDTAQRMLDALEISASYATVIDPDWNPDASGWVPLDTTPSSAGAQTYYEHERYGAATISNADIQKLTFGGTEFETLSHVFTKRQKWVYHGNFYWEGEAGSLSWHTEVPHWETNPYVVYRVGIEDPSVCPVPLTQKTISTYNGGRVRYERPAPLSGVCLFGREYQIPQASTERFCLGASLRWLIVDDGDPELYVQAAILDRDDREIQFTRVRMEDLGRATLGDDYAVKWTEYGTFDLTDYYNVGCVHWSQDATKAIFRVEKLSGSPVTQCLNPYDWADGVPLELLIDDYEDWVTDHITMDPLQAEYWELTAGGTTTLNEVVSGLEMTFEHSMGPGGSAEIIYGYSVTGTCTAIKGYVNNEIVTVEMEVNDTFTVDTSFNCLLTGEEMQEDFTRKLIFPSDKEVIYYRYAAESHVLTEDAVIVSFDYIDLETEDVGGVRITYGSDLDTPNKQYWEAVDVSIELFWNDDILVSEAPTDAFPFFSYNPCMSWPNSVHCTDMLGFWDHPTPSSYTGSLGSGADDYAGNACFIPFNPAPLGSVSPAFPTGGGYIELVHSGGPTYKWGWELHPAEQKICYGSKMLPLGESWWHQFLTLGEGKREDSYIERAWSVRGPGLGLYCPAPWFGGTAMFYDLSYEGETLKGAHTRKFFLRTWGPQAIYDEGPPVDLYEAGSIETNTTFEEKHFKWYESTLDLGTITGLGGSLTDDIFPIGVTGILLAGSGTATSDDAPDTVVNYVPEVLFP